MAGGQCDAGDRSSTDRGGGTWAYFTDGVREETARVERGGHLIFSQFLLVVQGSTTCGVGEKMTKDASNSGGEEYQLVEAEH